jgi:hypothetical protein
MKNIRKLTSLMTLLTVSMISLIVAHPVQAQDVDSRMTKDVILVHGARADGFKLVSRSSPCWNGEDFM